MPIAVVPGTAVARLVLASLTCLVVANCTVGPFSRSVDPKYGVAASPRVVEEGQPVPKGGGYRRLGAPYVVAGRIYTPAHNPNYRAEGLASWYGRDFHGRRTANGEIFDMESISAAHPTLPIPSYARVTNLANGRSLVVRVNDRGPFKDDRVIDLSLRSAELLDFRNHGVARVRVEYVGPASLKGSDDRKLMATLRHDGRPAPAPSTVLVAAGAPFTPAAPAPVLSHSAAVPNPPDRPFSLGRYTAGPVITEPGEVHPVAVATNAVGPRTTFARSIAAGTAPVIPVTGITPFAATGRGLY